MSNPEVVTQFSGHDLDEFVELVFKEFISALRHVPLTEMLADPIGTVENGPGLKPA